MSTVIIPEGKYEDFIREMSSIHAVSSMTARRRGMEQRYYQHHKARGIRLRAKYRPS